MIQMHDLISRQAAIDKIEDQIRARLNWLSDSRMERQGLDVALCVIEDLPSAQPEQKRGRNKLSDYPSLFECSVCGCLCDDTYYVSTCEFNYCPKCGARMDGDTE